MATAMHQILCSFNSVLPLSLSDPCGLSETNHHSLSRPPGQGAEVVALLPGVETQGEIGLADLFNKNTCAKTLISGKGSVF